MRLRHRLTTSIRIPLWVYRLLRLSHRSALVDGFPGVRPAVTNRTVHYAPTLGVAYFETPKVACSTIKKILQYAEVDGDTDRLVWTQGGPGTVHGVHDRRQSPLESPQDLGRRTRSILRSGDVRRVTFVRNPFTRVLSAYLDKIVNNPWERRRHLPGLGLDPDDEPTFPEFTRILSDSDPADLDPHFMPQWLLIGSGQISYDMIGRFENLEEDLTRLADIVGVSDHLETLDLRPVNATSAGARTADYYDEASAGRVVDIYRDDFEQFGYESSAPGIWSAST